MPCTTFIISLRISLFVRELGEREKRRDGGEGHRALKFVVFQRVSLFVE